MDPTKITDEQRQDLAAIQRGIEDMEAGRLISLEEADVQIRRELGFPPPKN